MPRRFAFAPTGAGPSVTTVKGDEIARDGKPETNKANVAYHYDVSNEFYRLFLDREMVYTCAYFAEDHWDIDRAQADKLEMICRKLRLKPGERMLDIGCGWGALVCYAAKNYGVEPMASRWPRSSSSSPASGRAHGAWKARCICT